MRDWMNINISMSFRKQEVINKLEKNRSEHEAIYNEAVEGYRVALKEALLKLNSLVSDKLGELKDIKLPKPSLKEYPLNKLHIPTNSLKGYDTVLEMLSLTPDETIVLDQNQYNCYMKDNWHWMEDFLINNSAYSVGATNKLNSMYSNK